MELLPALLFVKAWQLTACVPLKSSSSFTRRGTALCLLKPFSGVSCSISRAESTAARQDVLSGPGIKFLFVGLRFG